MDIIGRLRNTPPPVPVPVDEMAVRAHLRATDPDFARVSSIQHDALQVVGGQGIADGIALHREVEFWKRNRAE